MTTYTATIISPRGHRWYLASCPGGYSESRRDSRQYRAQSAAELACSDMIARLRASQSSMPLLSRGWKWIVEDSSGALAASGPLKGWSAVYPDQPERALVLAALLGGAV